jgi:hypothetical protein
VGSINYTGPVLITQPRSGRATQERIGRADQGKAAAVTAPSVIANGGTEGHGGQENNGTVSTGRTGRIS